MNGEYAAAIEAERAAWDNLMQASDDAFLARLRVDWDAGYVGAEEHAESVWLSRLAIVREGIARERWHSASERLAEASALFVTHREPNAELSCAEQREAST